MKGTEVEKKEKKHKKDLNYLLSKMPFPLLDPSAWSLWTLKPLAQAGATTPLPDGGLSISPSLLP